MLGSSRQIVWSAATVLTLATGAMTACNDDDTITGTLTTEQQNAQVVASARSDGNVLALLHQSNLGEIAAGTIALTKASDAAVKTFAQQMINEHTTLDAQGNALALSQGIALALPDNLLPQINAAESDTLSASAAGTAFDRIYMAGQVRDHIRTLALVDQSIVVAQNAQLKATLQTAVRPAVAMHLQLAQTIQSRIGTP